MPLQVRRCWLPLAIATAAALGSETREDAGKVGGVGQRCGGRGWTGASSCPAGLYCNHTNLFWWDCQRKVPPPEVPRPLMRHDVWEPTAHDLAASASIAGAHLSQAGLVDRINTRFATGHPTSDLSAAGILVHQFHNGADGDWKPWMPCPATCYGGPCWCAKFGDRFSATILSARTLNKKGEIGMYSRENPGFIFSPDRAKVLCAYPADGGSESKGCKPGQEGCAPGCGARWCRFDPASPHNMDTSCAWHTSELWRVLQLQEFSRSNYNEVVVEAKAFVDSLPSSIEAIFYVKGSPAEDQARRVHADFLATFAETNLAVRRVPLLEMDTENPQAPFRDVTSTRAAVQAAYEVPTTKAEGPPPRVVAGAGLALPPPLAVSAPLLCAASFAVAVLARSLSAASPSARRRAAAAAPAEDDADSEAALMAS